MCASTVSPPLSLAEAHQSWPSLSINDKIVRLGLVLKQVDASMSESCARLGFTLDEESASPYDANCDFAIAEVLTIDENLDALSKIAYDLEALAEVVKTRTGA